jgi:transcriptional regulator with XRE-family HTH domain
MAKKYKTRELAQLLRDEIRRRKLTQYRIAQETGIKQPSLCKFLSGGSLRIETAAKLLDYLGFEVVRGKNAK